MRKSFDSEGIMYSSGESQRGFPGYYAVPSTNQTEGLSGIGLLMQQDEGAGSPVFIKSIVPGGSCDRDGKCRPGDFVIAVNDEKVSHLPVADIREKIVGAMGTTVKILFQDQKGIYYERMLVRGTPSYFELQGQPSNATATETRLAGNGSTAYSMSREPERYIAEETRGREETRPDQSPSPAYVIASSATPMRYSFGEAAGNAAMQSQAALSVGRLSASGGNQFLSRSLDGHSLLSLGGSFDRTRSLGEKSEVDMCKDELSRTKALLEQDKVASMKYVKEIDALQRKNSEQVMQLQGMLNKSEQARKELEAQVLNGRTAEQELQISLGRVREQAEAREQYFANMKRQFDEAMVGWEREMAREKSLRVEAERERDQSREALERLRREAKSAGEREAGRRAREDELRVQLQEAEGKLVAARHLEARLRGQYRSLCQRFGQWHADFFAPGPRGCVELEKLLAAQ